MAIDPFEIWKSFVWGVGGDGQENDNGMAGPGTPEAFATHYGITPPTFDGARQAGIVPSSLTFDAASKDDLSKVLKWDAWDMPGCQKLVDTGDPGLIDTAYRLAEFDMYSGEGTAVKKLQEIVGVGDDGDFGGKTLAACIAYQKRFGDLAVQLASRHVLYLAFLGPKWTEDGHGWTVRMFKLEGYIRRLTSGS